MIRQLKENDMDFEEKLKEIALLEEKIFLSSSYGFLDLKNFFKEIKAQNREVYKIFIEQEYEKIISYLIVLDSLDSYDILKIAVREDYRGKNIATKLLEKISDRNIFLEVRMSNLRAINFYKKNNFIKISERKNYYKDNNEDAVLLQY